MPAKDFLLKITLIKSFQQVRVKFVMELVSHPADDRIKKKSDLVGENVTGELPATAAMA